MIRASDTERGCVRSGNSKYKVLTVKDGCGILNRYLRGYRGSFSGCGSAWLERLVWDQEVAGSNPVTPIVEMLYKTANEPVFLAHYL